MVFYCIKRPWFIHSLIDGSLNCFHSFSLTNNAGINIFVHVSSWVIYTEVWMASLSCIISILDRIFMLMVKQSDYLEKNEVKVSAGRNRMWGIGSEIVWNSRWIRYRILCIFLKNHLLKKSILNIQVNWATIESHRYSSTFEILPFVSMLLWSYLELSFFILWKWTTSSFGPPSYLPLLRDTLHIIFAMVYLYVPFNQLHVVWRWSSCPICTSRVW